MLTEMASENAISPRTLPATLGLWSDQEICIHFGLAYFVGLAVSRARKNNSDADKQFLYELAGRLGRESGDYELFGGWFFSPSI
jgi:hypothetical protein